MKLEKLVKITVPIVLAGAGAYVLIKRFENRQKYHYRDGYEGLPFYMIQRIKRKEAELEEQFGEDWRHLFI